MTIRSPYFNVLNKAFTLAEVLITLGIIGVVAAITIPALVNNIQDAQFKTAWKKEYSTIMQAINQIYADEGLAYNSTDYPAWGDTSKYFCKMIKRMNVLRSGVDCTDENNPVHSCSMNSNCYWHKLSAYKTKNGSLATHNGAFDYTTAVLADGSLLRLDSMNNFWVDVNGFKAPNTIGKDIFYFLITTDGKNKPYFWGVVNSYDNSSPSYTTITSNNYMSDCQSGTGWGCSAAYLLDNN